MAIPNQASEGTTAQYWARVCPDATGRGYVAHNSDLDDQVHVSYELDDKLVSVQLAAGYGSGSTDGGHYIGPRCAPAPTSGVHVVYHLGTSVEYRTVGAPSTQ